ncbi:MAG: 30S ribosomal protein S10, partial [Candidatus Odinarchaeia archaeon]
MPQKARIRLSSTDQKTLEAVCEQVKSITKRTGINISGPIPLPTKKLVVPLRKT